MERPLAPIFVRFADPNYREIDTGPDDIGERPLGALDAISTTNAHPHAPANFPLS
jgi:hypothetical protein